MVARGLAGESLCRRQWVLTRFSNEACSLKAATPCQVENWLIRLSVSPRTANTYFADLKAFYKWAELAGEIKKNPTRNLYRKKVPQGRPRPIDTAQLSDALKLARPRTRAFLALAAFQGLRCCEIAGLWAEDVVGDTLLIVRAGKGGKERTLPLNPDARAALVCSGLPASGPVFLNHFGRPYTPQTVSREINTYLHSIGIEATAHQLRHWFGTETYAESKDLRLTQELMGHSSPAVTAIYVRHNVADSASVVATLSKKVA